MPKPKIKLVDTPKPELYRDFFPYSELPKIVFEKKTVPSDLPKDIWITDTTFRDGQQARPPYTPQQVLNIFDFLHKIDNDTGLIRQTEFFLYSPRDRKALDLCRSRGE